MNYNLQPAAAALRQARLERRLVLPLPAANAREFLKRLAEGQETSRTVRLRAIAQ